MSKLTSHNSSVPAPETAPLVRRSARKGREQARRASGRARRLLRAVYNSVPGSIRVVDDQHLIVDISESIAELYQLPSRDDAIGKPCREVCRCRERDCEDCSITSVLRTGRRVVRMASAQEEQALGGAHKVFVNPIRDADGEVIGAVEFVIDARDLLQSDVTPDERQEMNQRNLKLRQHIADRTRQLLQSKMFLSETSRVGQVGGWELEFADGAMTWTDELFHIFGITPESRPDRNRLLECFPTAQRTRLDEALRLACDEALPFDLELQARTPFKQDKCVRIIGRPVSAYGKVERIVGVVRDLTHLRETEDLLARRSELLESVMQVSKAVVLVLDTQGQVMEINASGRHRFGLIGRDPIGERWWNLIAPPQQHQEIRDFLDSLYREDTPEEVLQTLRKPGGGDVIYRWSHTPLTDTKGSINGLLLIGYDVTDGLEREEQLRQAQKTEVIGQLAGGIAHDFNNLLTVIHGNALLLKMQLQDYPDKDGLLEQVIEATGRATDLTKKLLHISRKHNFQREPMDLHEAVRQAAGLLQRCLPSGVKLVLELYGDRSDILGDATLLQSALLNLGVNARDAMPDGGTLRIATRTVRLSGKEPGLEDYKLSPGEYIELAVADTGCGMDEETRKHIFKPFFTTKPEGKGTGLGLPSVLNCVCDHNGGLTLHTTAGQGTTFRLLLPLLADDAET